MIVSAIVAGVTLAAQAASSIIKGQQERKLGNIQAHNQQLQLEATIKNFSQQANANSLRYSQEKESAIEQQQQVYLENLKSKATAQTSAASSGISGNSIENLFRNYERATSFSNFITERNLRNMGLQYDANYEATRANALNSIYGLQSYTGPSMGQEISQGIFQIGQTTAGFMKDGAFNFKGTK